MSLARFNNYDNDETPLLRAQSDDAGDAPHKQTPLPATQISVLVLPWIAESIVAHSISPYINQLVRELPIVGGDVRKVGYYTGIIVALHHASEVVTVFHWNRLSDHIGRKPVLLACIGGTTVSMVLFGLSRSFWAIVLSRCLHGAVKGNLGVVKSVMAELTDETNIARGFSLLLMTWAIGIVFGPLIGGVLSRPQDRWPGAFSHPFWDKYPYFLPCLVSGTLLSLSFIIVALFLEETVKFQPILTNSDVIGEGSSDVLDQHSDDSQKPLPLRSVLTRPVLISLANYAVLALFEMASLALIPLIWSTSVEFGGLNLSPASIGLWMSVYGCMDGLFQFALAPRILERFGAGYAFMTSITACAVVYIMFPFENLALRMRQTVGGPNAVMWLLILLQLSSLSIQRMGFSAVYVFISSAAPNKRSLGATNGLGQTIVSIQRTFGPAVADSLFAFSVTNNVLGGNFVYVVLLVLVSVGLYIASRLPRHGWAHSSKSVCTGWTPGRE
ncbi:MFS general substrate transporter [Russula dissimulans]|nr:MFS general substrate transporter [Russula dissimulans]